MTLVKLPLLAEAMSTLSRWAAELRKLSFVTEDDLAALMQANGSVVFPVGSPIAILTEAVPLGYLLLDGQDYPKSDYSELYKVYGYQFGGGGDRFNVPDLRGRYLFGKAASGTGSTLQGTFGAIDHSHTMPAHYHAMGTGADLATASGGAHQHFVVNTDSAPGGGLTNANYLRYFFNQTLAVDYSYDLQGSNTVPTVALTNSAGAHTHTLSGRVGLVTGGVDGNAAQTSGTSNPPSIVCNWMTRY